VNREQKLTRLQTLLERVQTRAKGREPRAPATAAFAMEADTIPRRPSIALGLDIAPVQPMGTSTSESFDVDETRPFVRFPSTPGKLRETGPPAGAARRSEPDPLEAELGPQLEEEPPVSSRLTLVSLEHDPALDLGSDKARVKSSPVLQVQPGVAREPVQLEVDTGRVGLGAMAPGAGPTMEQLGWTVDLEEGPREVAAALELDDRPIAKKPQRPAAEMEAEIPSLQLSAGLEAARHPPVAKKPELPSAEWDAEEVPSLRLPDAFDVARQPPVAKKPERPAAEWDAEIPSLQWPAAFEGAGKKPAVAPGPDSAQAAPPRAQELGAEAATAVPAAATEPAAPAAQQLAVQQAPGEAAVALVPTELPVLPAAPAGEQAAARQQPVPAAPAEPAAALAADRPVTLELVPEPSPALAPPTPPVVVAPVVVRVQPAVARAPVIGATDIAKFQGHVEAFQPTTFLALLDASLGLRGSD
jgi:hypothetical protein